MSRPIRYRKSSFSGANNACVEVASDLRSVRDSKNPDGPVLYVHDLRALTAVIKYED